jgi:hypothetical protein
MRSVHSSFIRAVRAASRAVSSLASSVACFAAYVSAVATASLALSLVAPNAHAQTTMYKHVDKDGKVTYSDKPPRPGEKAEAVVPNRDANTVKLDTKGNTGREQKFSDVKGRSDARVAERDRLQKSVDEAEQALAKAKKAREDGRDPLPDEQRIVVGKGGANAVMRNPDYTARQERLEKSVKDAEAALAKAVEQYSRGAPN